jgi:hypothetical protein
MKNAIIIIAILSVAIVGYIMIRKSKKSAMPIIETKARVGVNTKQK